MVKKTSLFIIWLCSSWATFAQIQSPKEHFGFNIGDNYKLATYQQTEAYFKKLVASDRVKLVDIGLTEEGRTQFMLIVSAPDNIKNLDQYKEISQKLARAENITNEQARTFASSGKAIVWIDGGLHATETVGTHQLIETAWQLVSRNDPETLRILDQVVILLVHANPDGQELVTRWYMRNADSLKRSTSNLPRLYQKYIGHDNNRDFFMMNMNETKNMSRQLYIEWMPQILYNHHQSGPPGAVVAGAPYRDPFNYVFDPLLVTTIDALGAAMNTRLNLEEKPGYTQRTGAPYSTWWNGGLRTAGYFHNIVGLLTEIIGSPTPSQIPLVPSRLIPHSTTPNPVTPQKWLFRQSIDYSVSLNYAVLDFAVRNKEHLLYNIYRMGKNSIERGNRDHWTLSPKHIEAINDSFKKDQRSPRSADSSNLNEGRSDTIPVKYYNLIFKDLNRRDPRGYIIPANQPEYLTAVKFINALIYSGIRVHKATSDFSVEGKNYPSGSYIVKTNQAFRPHVMDMFEPQDHPNDFQYPGGPPIPPYDAAGWTPAFSMGFQFDRILNGFEGPFQPVPYGHLQTPRGQLPNLQSTAGYILDSRSNNSFLVVNDLLKSGAEIFRLPDPGRSMGKVAKGSFYVPVKENAAAIINKAATETGLNIIPVISPPADPKLKVSPKRIGLWDTYGGSMSSGWLRWILEQYHFPFNIIYSKEIDEGKLRDKYDIIIFVTGAIPPVTTTGRTANRDTAFKIENIPSEFHKTVGRITVDTSILRLKQFLEAGGTVVTIGSSTNLAYHLKLPVRNALVEMNNGKERALPREKFYIPGSVMRVKIDSTQPAAWGMNSEADVFFTISPVFKLAPDAISNGTMVPIAWFASEKTLRSGWAWGQEYLQDGVAAFVAKVGPGKLYAFGPEITFRSQTHGTFKLLFNQLYSESQ